MANPLWPTTLPQLPTDPSFFGYPKITPAANAVRTNMETGPAKQRRRFTALPTTVDIQMHLQEAEMNTLATFVSVTLQDVLPFDWVDFTNTGNVATYRFMGGQRPVYTWDGGDMWIATFTLEKLP